MEENSHLVKIEKTPGKFKKFLVFFFLASLWAVVFVTVCVPFLINVEGLSDSEKAFLGGVNMMRVVLGFGLLSLLASYFIVIKKKSHKAVALFLWVFWIIGLLSALLVSSENGGIQAYPLVSNEDVPMLGIGTILPMLILFVWLFGIYFCEKIAGKLSINKSLALVVGIFLPVISILIYSLVLYRTKTKEKRNKILKVGIGTIAAIIFISSGAFYYLLGTPQYSLFKLKGAIMKEDSSDFEKYFDVQKIAEQNSQTPEQFKEEMMRVLNTSFLSIMEPNPDKSKDANIYIPTGLTGKYLEKASFENGTDNFQIDLEFDSKGAGLLADITRRNIGKTIGIYLGGQLVSQPVVKEEIAKGMAVVTVTDQDRMWARAMTKRINEEKQGMIADLKIKETRVSGTSAHVIVGRIENGKMNGIVDLSMTRTPERYWQVNAYDLVSGAEGQKLPSPEGEKVITFDWKYKGKNYSLDQKLYDSYYKFYGTLPAQSFFNGESIVQELEKRNELFIGAADGDNTISELAQSIKAIGEEKKLDANQIVELVASFVQTIPYDYDEFNNREVVVPKIDYPYETLYKNTGICSDKSYLAYSLLRELGYGASFFEFPEDQHIAVGVECPLEYSNYGSGYCFLETTSLGNKIGSTPSIIKESGIAASKIVLSDDGTDETEDQSSPLGKIEVVNKSSGLSYTGIIDTVNTQKKIDNLLYTIRKMDNELNASRKDLDSRNEEIGKIVDKLDKIAKSNDSSAYDDYNRLYSKYKGASSDFEKIRKAFNAKIATRNKLNDQYNNLVKSFYQ